MAQVDSENSTAVPGADTAGARVEKTPESPQDASLYIPTDVTPEVLFQAIGRLRKEARDEVDRLIRFLDKTDDYVSRELEDDDSANHEEGGDIEPSLGFLDHITNQTRICEGLPKSQFDCDREDEHDGLEPQEDDEPSLGALDRETDQRRSWRIPAAVVEGEL
jgi:hypothetical protein